MKTISKGLLIVHMLGAFVLSTTACSKENLNSGFSGYLNVLEVGEDGTSFIKLASLESELTGTGIPEEKDLEILLHMKEEEKLARDVYSSLYEKWGSQIFSNISSAENTHLNAVILLLQKYGDDYTNVGEKGKFSNPDFQKLYDKLVAQGSSSLAEAYKTGALIEELDIKDLNEYLEILTNESIRFVFQNLNRGSRNHLRAFNRQITRLGLTYTPIYISQAEYDQIISSPNETGNGNQMGGNRGQGRRYGQKR